ncbi:MAG: hypothetical protein KAR05_11315 [Candidatus Omnitrophica bacterium]|nr:hypothetical protein [Candidatus Omnitrophota bacterium]
MGSKILVKNFLSFLVFSVFVFLALGSTDGGNRDPNAWLTEDNSIEASVMMQDFVKARLKSPASAKFPGVFEGSQDHVKHMGNQEYVIDSYVDSQNGFGAMIRTYFRCKIKQVSDDSWRLISLDIK